MAEDGGSNPPATAMEEIKEEYDHTKVCYLEACRLNTGSLDAKLDAAQTEYKLLEKNLGYKPTDSMKAEILEKYFNRRELAALAAKMMQLKVEARGSVIFVG